jgi:integrase/recombinase XerD
MSAWNRYIKDFVSYLKIERGLADNSILAYQNDVQKLIDYSIPRQKTVIQLTYNDLKDFVAVLYDLGLSARSQARIISGLKQFFGFLLLENEIKDDPSELLELPKIGRKLPEFLTIEEIDLLIDSVDLSKNEGHRNRAILETLYSCGLRVSELVNLTCSGYYPKEGFIRIIGKGNKERLVPIGSNAMKYIDQYQQHIRQHQRIQTGQEDFLFLNRSGRQLSRVMIFYLIKSLAVQAGINKNISPQTFRHSFATHLVEGGADLRAVQEMLGHESITTTEIYTHLNRDFLRDTLQKYHPSYRS